MFSFGQVTSCWKQNQKIFWNDRVMAVWSLAIHRPSTQWPNFDPAYLNIVAAGVRSVFSRSGSFTILDSHSEVSKDFIDQKARQKRCTKSLNPIFRCTTPSTGRIWGEVVVGTLYQRWYSVLMTTSPHICPVDGVVHRNIGLRPFVHRNIGFRPFVHRFRLVFFGQ